MMDKHIATLEKVYSRIKEGDFYDDYDDATKLLGEFREAIAAIALMRGQSEVAAWQVRVFYPREQKWSKWQDISQDSYEAAKREGYYYEYTVIELRELVPAKKEPADEQ